MYKIVKEVCSGGKPPTDLADWQKEYLCSLLSAWGKNKIILNGVEDSDIDTINALEKGVNMGNNISESVVNGFKMTELIRYGWTGVANPGYYRPDLWTREQILAEWRAQLVDPAIAGSSTRFGKKIVCISDTHFQHKNLKLGEGGDILICSGDVIMPWAKTMIPFFNWMAKQPFRYKIFVAGNHDYLVERDAKFYRFQMAQRGIIYLQDSGVNIEGIKIWGTPWTPIRRGNKNNAFTKTRPELIERWNKIPKATELLITHCPPFSVGDCNTDEYRASEYQSGDWGLYKTINRLPKLRLHVFGHQHFGRGVYKHPTRNIVFANCATAYIQTPYVFN